MYSGGWILYLIMNSIRNLIKEEREDVSHYSLLQSNSGHEEIRENISIAFLSGSRFNESRKGV